MTSIYVCLHQPLPPQEEKRLKETLQAIIGAGKTVLLEQKLHVEIGLI
ncbi:ATP synthase subunit O, mitochondrial [Senna tora]|uniref:ATP synthase subunit O, mitochondrial n=1 Tax=Senna tora TaxID=362788 RepID=A0A834WWK9_9FABA|nr:ATP synthase subunit O, mitochondrial [Senna tora]